MANSNMTVAIDVKNIPEVKKYIKKLENKIKKLESKFELIRLEVFYSPKHDIQEPLYSFLDKITDLKNETK